MKGTPNQDFFLRLALSRSASWIRFTPALSTTIFGRRDFFSRARMRARSFGERSWSTYWTVALGDGKRLGLVAGEGTGLGLAGPVDAVTGCPASAISAAVGAGPASKLA